MDGEAWRAAVHGIAEGRTRLSDFTLTFHFHALEKEMATHSSVLAWRIPGTGEPGGLPSMQAHRVRHNWSDLAAAAVHSFIYRVNCMLSCSCRCNIMGMLGMVDWTCRPLLTTRALVAATWQTLCVGWQQRCWLLWDICHYRAIFPP